MLPVRLSSRTLGLLCADIRTPHLWGPEHGTSTQVGEKMGNVRQHGSYQPFICASENWFREMQNKTQLPDSSIPFINLCVFGFMGPVPMFVDSIGGSHACI